MNWVRAALPDKDVSNFTTDWNNGLCLSSLVDYCKPGLIPDHASLDPNNGLANITKAMDLAEKELGVPQVMSPEDLAVEKPDELSVMTYVSGFCRPDAAGQNSLLDWVNSKIPNHPVSNFTTDWVDGRAVAALVDSLTEGEFPEYDQMKEDDRYKNCQEAMDAAERLLGISKTTTPEEFSEKEMDHLTRSAYIMQFRHAKPSPRPSLASTLKAVGPGITGDSVEKETNFVVRGPRIPQWAKLETTIKSPPDGKELPVKMQSTSPKATQVHYTPEVPGEYVIDITLNSEPIPGSTFHLTHHPPTNVDGCVATGSGLNKARVGETAGFSVNCEQGGPGELQVDIEGPNGNIVSDIEETTEKNYSVNYTPAEPGDHMISVLWDSKDIPSSPFSCVVTDPKKCTVSGPGLSKALLGEPQTFQVKADKAGPGEVVVEIEGPSGSPVSPDIKDKGNSIFDVTYIPKETGPHKVKVLWDKDPIPGSPFSVNVLAPADASKCTVSNIPQGKLRADNTYSFDVDATNAGSGELKASAQGPTVPESCDMKEKAPGLYSVQFTPREVGPLKVEVAYGDNAVPESPFDFTVNDPKKVKVNRAAIENGTYYVRQPLQFVVSAAHAGDGEVKASARNPNGEEDVEVKDQGGKSYLLSYSPKEGGSHAINITFDGSDVLDAPLRIFIDDSNRADAVVVTQPLPSKIGAFLVDTPYEYKVMTADAGQDELTATSVGAKTGLKPSVKITEHDTEQSVVLTAETPDDYLVSIKWGGEHVPGSPFKLTVEDKPQADKVVCSSPRYTVGSSEPVTLDANAEKAGAGKLEATCYGKEVGNVDVSIAESEPKKYTVSFSPPKDDIYSLSVFWLSESVENSPFKINLIPPDSSKCIVSGPEIPVDPAEPITLYIDATNAGNGEIKASAVGDKTGEKPVNIIETEPNKFVLSFNPNLTDFYTMDVKWAGENVPGAPFRVYSSAANADKVMICEPPTPMLEAGQAIGICFDTSKGGKGNLTATCKGKSIGEIPISVRQRSMDKDKYDVRFLPPEPDIFIVNVLWGGIDVKGSPFTINLMPVDVSKIKVIGPSMPHGPSGPVELMLQTAGAGRGKVTGTCAGKKVGSVEVVIKETSTDVHELCFIPSEPDVYTFNVQYGSQKLNGSPFIINTLPANAGLVKVREPESIDIGKPLTYRVDTTEAGSGKLGTICRSSKSGLTPLDTVSEATGHYTVSFTPRNADLYNVSMDWAGETVPGSPFKVDLRPPMANNVKVGDLHVPDEVGPGKYVWLDLDCTDAGHGPLKGEAKGKITGKMPIEADRLARAKYRMKFLPKEPDTFSFAVAYGDNQVAGSPFKINLQPSRAGMVKHTRTSLPELEGGPVSMYFDTTEAGRGEMTTEIYSDATKNVTKKVEKTSFTEHKVTFIPSVPDIYNAEIKWSGISIDGSPFQVDTRPPLHPELIVCSKPVFTDINQPVYLTMDTSQAGPGRVSAKCVDADKVEVPVDIKRPTSLKEKYNISFVPPKHSEYSLSILFEGEDVKDSPFLVDLNPVMEPAEMVLMENEVESFLIPEDFASAPTPEGDKTADEESTELTAYIGEPLNLQVAAEDEDKKNGEIKATARGDKTGTQEVTVSKNDDSTFNVYFNPRVPDRYTIDVLLDGEPVPNSPIVINYIPSVDPSKCKIFGLEKVPPIPQVNEHIQFGVDAREAGDGKLSVTSDGPSLENVPTVLNVKDSPKGERGIYDITYLPTALGEHRVHLLWNGEVIPESPVVFRVGDLQSIQRFPYGKPVTLDINAGDSPKGADLSAHAIHKETDNKLKVKVNKDKKGHFKLSFQPKKPGIYAVHIFLKKKEIPGSPYLIKYLGPSNPGGVEVTGFTGKGYVGVPITYTVNTEKAGTGELAVRVDGPKEVQDSDLTYERVANSKDMCYNVSYIPRNEGGHKFHITWDKKPIPASPLSANVMDVKPEYKTALSGKGTNVVEVGSSAPVRIANGGPSVSLESIAVTCEGVRSGSHEVAVEKIEKEEEKGGDEYLVNFVPEVSDDYTLTVKHNDSDIEGSPFHIKAIDKEMMSLDYNFPEEPLPSDVPADAPVTVVRDAPLSVKDPSDVNAAVEGPYGSCPTNVTTDANGKVGVRFVPPLSGSYKVDTATKDGSKVFDSPSKIRASGKDVDPSKVSIKDMSIFENPIPFGKPARFSISTADAGPGTLNITSKGPGKATVKVLDNKDGTYTCDFTPSIAGKYHIDILWNDHHISGSPYLLVFKSKKNRVIAGLNLEEENFRIDIPHRFKLHCGEVGEGVLELKCKPPSAAAVRLSPLASGKNSYQCEIIPKEVGNHEILVQYNGKHIFGSPFNVQFERRGDASKCRMVESSVTGEESGQENVSFMISTEGAGRGKLTSFVEQTSTKKQLPVTVTAQSDDSYKIEFNPDDKEEYLLTIKYDSEHIVGSPFKLMFGGDAADASQCTTEGDGIEACIVDREAKFTVNTLRPNQGELSVTITGGEGHTIKPKMSPLGDTTNEVTYVAEKTGTYTLSVKWGDEEIPNSPFRVECYDPSDPSILKVHDPPTEHVIGSPLTFTVKASAAGVAAASGSLVVTAQSAQNKLIHGTAELSSEDGLSYNCALNDFPDTGKYLVHVRWNGSHVKESPFKVKVLNPPKPSLVKAYGPGLENGFVGQEGNFTVETEDGGAGTLAVRVHGPKGAFKINMRRHPDNDRTILVRYDPKHVGKYTVDITWSEVHIPGSPFEVEFSEQQ